MDRGEYATDLAERLVRRHGADAEQIAREYAAAHARMGRLSVEQTWFLVAELIPGMKTPPVASEADPQNY